MNAPRPLRLIKPGEELLFFGAAASDIPPLDIPQPTEPAHIGKHFDAPCSRDANQGRGPDCPVHPRRTFAPIRAVEHEHPWLWLVYLLSAAAAVLVSALLASRGTP